MYYRLALNYVAQADFKLSNSTASASEVLVLQACASTPCWRWCISLMFHVLCSCLHVSKFQCVLHYFVWVGSCQGSWWQLWAGRPGSPVLSLLWAIC